MKKGCVKQPQYGLCCLQSIFNWTGWPFSIFDYNFSKEKLLSLWSLGEDMVKTLYT